MAEYFIDPSSASNGVGSFADPYNVWPAFAAGNRYYQKRGTTKIGSLTVASTGTITAPIYVGAYGDAAAPKPLITCGPAAHGAILFNNINYLTIEDFQCTSPVSTGNGHGVSAYSQVAGRLTGIALRRLDIFNTKNQGIELVQYGTGNAYSPSSNMRIEDCTISVTGGHGIGIAGKFTQAYIAGCTVDQAGQTYDTYGISLGCIKGTFSNAGWTLTSGTIYSRALTLANINGAAVGALDYISHVSCGSAALGFNLLAENTGTPTTPSVGQFGFSADTLYVNLGAPNPWSGQTILVAAEQTKGILVHDCTVTRTKRLSVEGSGIVFDDMATGIVSGCRSFDNGGSNFQSHRGRDTKFISCHSSGAKYRSGFAFIATAGGSVINCVDEGSPETSVLTGATANGLIVRNTIMKDAPIGISGPADTVADHNGYENIGTPCSGFTSGGSDQTTALAIGEDLRPQQGSPLIAAGVYNSFSQGLDHKIFQNPPSIGAYEYVRPRAPRL